jgi:thiamine transporter
MSGEQIRTMTYVAAAASLGVILSMVKLYTLPQGGSINLASLPILFLALLRGSWAGIAAGSLLGLLKLLLGATVVHPIQVLLDYPIAFAALGVAGCFRRYAAVGTLIGSVVRGVCHFLSGVVFFGSYAPPGVSVWKYSLGYNGSYLLPEMTIAVVVLPILIRRIAIRH